MKILLKITFLFLFISCKGQAIDSASQIKLENISLQVKELIKKNDSLERKVNEYNAASNSSIEVIDKVDNLYNNNFNRFIIFWGIVASIIIVIIPLYITRIQRKILEAKKIEIFNFSTNEIDKLEKKITLELQQKYVELTNLISESNENNKENLRKEFIKSHIISLFIASKINEIDKRYDMIFENLINAVMRANSIQYFSGVNSHLKNIFNMFNKLKAANIDLNKEKLKDIVVKLKTLREIEDIDQESLEKTIAKLE